MADDRIPVRFAAAGDTVPPGAGPHEVVLVEGLVGARSAGPRHGAGCVCCAGRGAVAAALGALFQARARGEMAWFTAVVAVVADAVAVTAEVQGDRVAAARFRIVA